MSMRGKRMLVLMIGLWLSLGCKTEPKLKPPSHLDDFVVPPLADSRFSSPEYPKAAFKTNNDIHKTPDESDNLTAGKNLTAGNRMSTPGMMPY
jgi:hypothetical protein